MQISWVRIIFVCLFLVEFVVGVFGNILVCLTVYRNKSMHSPVNYYIVNLGVCDFLVGAFVLPTKLFELTAEADLNVLNDGWCTAVRFLETIVVFGSVFTLLAICIERYYAVVYPVHCRIYLTHSRIGRILFLLWIFPVVIAAPSLYPATATSQQLYSDFGEFTRTICFDQFSDRFRRGYFLFLFFFIYVLPVIFIAATCISITRALMQKIPAQPHRDPRAVTLERGRRKVAKMVLIIVFTFLLTWSPYFMVTVVTQLQSHNFLHDGQYFFTMLCINLLCFTNSCVNPFVYFAMSARFRKGFKGILSSVWLCSRRKRYSPGNSTSSMRRGAGMQGYIHHRGGPTSSSTPNESTGNNKEPPHYHRCHSRNSHCRRSGTILLRLHSYDPAGTPSYQNPACQQQVAGTLVPMRDFESHKTNLHFAFEDFQHAQESSIV